MNKMCSGVRPGFLVSQNKTLYFEIVKKQIVLKKNEEHRILSGHQWVFSNEIKVVRGDPESGDLVELLRHDEKLLGIGFYNPHSLIAFRLLSSEREEVSFQFFEQRISQAYQLRRRLFPQSESFRMAHGESDFLPGLIIDKYNEYISLQTLSCGMDRRLTLICDVLESLFHPKAIVERNDSSTRTLEHLPMQKKVLRGTLEEVIISEQDAKFKIDILNGQKTGFFFDQRDNRRAVRRYVRDGTALDCFCNEGGFSIHAALAKAKSVTGLDISDAALGKARVNSLLNETARVSFEQADIFEELRRFRDQRKMFDVVILDPPSFTKSKKTVAAALRGYKEINALALSLINAGGFLASGSCSHHITEESFLSVIQQSALKSKRRIQLLQFAGAGPDHPVLPAMPETRYLKFGIFSVR